MTEKAISPLRRRLIEDMTIRRLSPKTQLHYIRHVKRFADFLGRSADKATTEDVHRYQLWLASIGRTVLQISEFPTGDFGSNRQAVSVETDRPFRSKEAPVLDGFWSRLWRTAAA